MFSQAARISAVCFIGNEGDGGEIKLPNVTADTLSWLRHMGFALL